MQQFNLKKEEIYNHLEKDFIKEGMTDDWSGQIGSIKDLVTENFKKRWMGLLFDSGSDLNIVYTAVFPSDKVMKEILDKDAKDAVLFTHHGATWDIREAPHVFKDIDRKLLEEFKRRNISIYTLHVPLDDFGPYSTTVTFSKEIGVIPESTFAPYFGTMCGVFGETKARTVEDLKKDIEKSVGHEVSLYPYGKKEIKEGVVGVVAGGGLEFVSEVEGRANVFVTGITLKSDYSKKNHDFAKEKKINIIGATHYSSEKFACIEMTDYFKKKGLLSEFIEDDFITEDM